jgi:hypothetical protein
MILSSIHIILCFEGEEVKAIPEQVLTHCLVSGGANGQMLTSD